MHNYLKELQMTLVDHCIIFPVDLDSVESVLFESENLKKEILLNQIELINVFL